MDDAQSTMKWRGGMKSSVLLVSASLLFSLNLPAQAQEEEELEELIVTGSPSHTK